MWSRFKYIEYPKAVRKNLIARDKAQKKEKQQGKPRKERRIWLFVLLVLLVLLLLLGGVFGFLWFRSRNNLHPHGEMTLDTGTIGLENDSAPVLHDSGRTIVYKGETYRFNEDLISVALLGVDKRNLGLDYGVVGTGGQADTIALALYDTQRGKIQVVVVPRDTMVEVNTFDTEGGFIDIKKQQICVAYAYGDGRETSCENTIKSVNRLLMGIPVDYYLAMDMDGIPALNDAIGGVTLTSMETIGRFTKGETITLMGEDADAYVRDRDLNQLDGDSARRARQRQYMEAFVGKALQQVRRNFSLVAKLYNLAMKYVVTDISLDQVTYLATTALSNEIHFDDFQTVPGSYRQGETYAEYEVDETAMFEMILSLYYEKQS